MTSEKWLEAQLQQEVEKRGGLCLKWVSPGWAGAPDRIVITSFGRVVFCELKSTGKRLRPLQRKRIAQLLAVGMRTWVVSTRQELEAFLGEVFGK